MESTRKTAQKWRRSIFCCRCCPARFNIFSTTKTVAASSDSKVAVKINRNGEVIMTQPGFSNDDGIHQPNGNAPRIEANALQSQVNDYALDREFDEIDLGERPSTRNEFNPQSTEVKTSDRLDPNKPTRTPSLSTESLPDLACKPQSFKSRNAHNGALTPQLTDMMLSDLIQECFDPSDELPQIIEEDVEKIDTNVVTEATADEVETAQQSARSNSETISTRSYHSYSFVINSAVDNHASPEKPPRVILDEIAPAPPVDDNKQSCVTKTQNGESSKIEQKEYETISPILLSASDTSPSVTPIQSNDYELENLQKYGDFHELAPAPTKSQMYGSVDEDSDSSVDDDNNNKKEILVIHAASTTSNGSRIYEQNEQTNNKADDRRSIIQNKHNNHNEDKVSKKVENSNSL